MRFTALLALAACLVWPASAGAASAQIRFTDDFENELGKWEIYGERGVILHDTGDPTHGRVMVLHPHGDVLALIKESEDWDAVRIEADVLFSDDISNYLGVVYNLQRRGERLDFGLIYIKGTDSYLQVNPHRDFNVSRTLYAEKRASLKGKAAIEIGQWQRIKIEVIGQECHFYVGDMATPQLTFSDLELAKGMLGLQPRSVGGDVWVDNVTVSAIDAFSYEGPALPRGHTYDPEHLLTEWQVAGPLSKTEDALARIPHDFPGAWRPFETDRRGGVITGRVVDYHGPNTVAYFRSQVEAGEAGDAVLHLSTVDDLALWVNGRFHWFIPRVGYAWYDFWRNPDHEGRRIPIRLEAGTNELVLRVRGGVYASGGFFARVERSQ